MSIRDNPEERNLSDEYYQEKHREARKQPSPTVPPRISPFTFIRRMIGGSHSFTRQRLTAMKRVTHSLHSMGIIQGRICLSNSLLHSKIPDMSIVGSGTFGEVYLGTINDTKVIIKEAVLDHKDRILASYKGDRVIPSKYWTEEYSIARVLNNLVISDVCPNFILTYDLALCNRCRVTGSSYSACSMTFMEPAGFTLGFAFRQRALGPASQLSLIAQLLIAVYYFQTTLQMVHNDIKSQNILLLETPALANTLFKYKPKGTHETFTIENTGLVLCLSDFGVADKMVPSRDTYANDVLDCIRTFTGGRRTVQQGSHKGYPLLSSELSSALRQVTTTSTYLSDPLKCLRRIFTDLNYKPRSLPTSSTFR